MVADLHYDQAMIYPHPDFASILEQMLHPFLSKKAIFVHDKEIFKTLWKVYIGWSAHFMTRLILRVTMTMKWKSKIIMDFLVDMISCNIMIDALQSPSPVYWLLKIILRTDKAKQTWSSRLLSLSVPIFVHNFKAKIKTLNI